MTINWGILGNALSQDYAGRVQQGFEAGKRIGDEAIMRRALSDYAADPQNQRALRTIAARNPELAAQLETRAREGRAREAVGTILGAEYGLDEGGAVNALMSPPTAPRPITDQPVPAPYSAQSQNALAVDPLAPPSERPVPAPPVQPVAAASQQSPAAQSPAAQAWRELARSAPDMFMQLRKLQGEERKAVADQLEKQLDIGGRVMSAVLSAPPEQQPALYQQFRQELEAAGVVDLPDQWDANAAQARVRMGMTVLQALGVKVREDRLEWDIEDDRLDNERADKNAASLDLYRRGQLANARRGQDIRSRDARRGQDVASRDRQRGQDITDKRVRESAAFRGRYGRVRRNEPLARGPNGESLVVRNGQWIDVNTGQPVQ